AAFASRAKASGSAIRPRLNLKSVGVSKAATTDKLLGAPKLAVVERRGWDLNPRATFRPPAVFKTAPFDRSGTPPTSIVAEAGFARLRAPAPRIFTPKEGAQGGTMGSPMPKTAPFDRSGTPPTAIGAEAG